MSLLRTVQIKEHLGLAFRFLRAKRGMTQGEVCARSGGCTTAMLSSYEKGHKAPSFETLASVLTGLGCDLSDLQAALAWAREPNVTAGPIMAENLGPALRSIRVRRREIQDQVAERAGVTKAMVSVYEKGRQVPSLPVLDRLLEALAVDFAELQREMRGEADQKPAIDRNEPEFCDRCHRLRAEVGLPVPSAAGPHHHPECDSYRRPGHRPLKRDAPIPLVPERAAGRCLIHFQDEPCPTFAGYKAAGL